MALKNEKIKAKLTALAQLVSMLGKYEGITETKDIAAATGYTKRAIQKAKNELQFANSSSREPSFANSNSQNEPECAENANHSSPSRTHIRAQNELPSEVVITRSSASAEGGVGGGEIPGLNGATATFVDVVAGLLAGPMGFPNPDTAEKLLRGFVETYGVEKTKRGILELQCAMERQKNINVPKALPGFIKNAQIESISKIDPDPRSENWFEKRNREALEYLDRMEEGAAH